MNNQKGNNLMEKIVSLCKRRGFVFQGSEIYGGTGSVWDYGPMGVLLKNNVKAMWWRDMVQMRDDIVGLDSAILMNPKVWEASGHVSGFHDPLVECKKCHKRFRQDHLDEIMTKTGGGGTTDDWNNFSEKDKEYLLCKKGEKHEFTESRQFNLMFKTFMGPVEDSAHATYLRPETAQGIFVNFKNVLETSRKKLPFGIAQIGKAFRNEITPGNFTFRTREFEQMELEYFVNPKEAEKCHKEWIEVRKEWYLQYGIKKENLKLREHDKKELAHYAKAATDVEYKFPFGWSELEGIANRQDFDLKQHEKFSGIDLKYFSEETKEKFIPFVIEPSGGVDRATLAFLVDAYSETPLRQGFEGQAEKGRSPGEVVLHLHPKLAPIKVAVFPLVKKEGLPKIAHEIYDELKLDWQVMYDEAGSVGKRYRRQDEIGTPFCITVDFDSLKNKTVTVRDRDSMKQEVVKIKELKNYLQEKFR